MGSERQEVRRPGDGELVGFVVEDPRGWAATTTFGVVLDTFTDAAAARDFLCAQGLAVLSRRWLLSGTDDAARPVVLVEAGVGWVRVRPAFDAKGRPIELRGTAVERLRPPKGVGRGT